MKDKMIRYSFICLILIVSLVQFSIASQAGETLSNELLAWGFRRGENHEVFAKISGCGRLKRPAATRAIQTLVPESA